MVYTVNICIYSYIYIIIIYISHTHIYIYLYTHISTPGYTLWIQTPEKVRLTPQSSYPGVRWSAMSTQPGVDGGLQEIEMFPLVWIHGGPIFRIFPMGFQRKCRGFHHGTPEDFLFQKRRCFSDLKHDLSSDMMIRHDDQTLTKSDFEEATLGTNKSTNTLFQQHN